MNLGDRRRGLVALIGTTELRELHRIPWYGTLANCGCYSAAVGRIVMEYLGRYESCTFFAPSRVGHLFAEHHLVSVLISPGRQAVLATFGGFSDRGEPVRLRPCLADGMYASAVGNDLFALPLYTTRVAYHFCRDADMFTQTIGALAGAVDKRDPYTSRHSHREADAVDIGRMRVGNPEKRERSSGRPPRRRQDRRAGQRPAEERPADARRADDDERPPGARRPDHRAGDEVARAADHSPPSRVVQRLRLPADR